MNDTLQLHDDAPSAVSKVREVVEQAGRMAGLQGDTVVGRTATISRPRSELYAYWRDFTNFPNFMKEIDRVEVATAARSRWTACDARGEPVEWDVVVTDERADGYVVWESAKGADVQVSGRADFRDATGGRGTEVTLTIAYGATGGVLGKLVATLLQREPGLQARRDLRRFKQLMETGEIAVSAWTNARAKAEKE